MINTSHTIPNSLRSSSPLLFSSLLSLFSPLLSPLLHSPPPPLSSSPSPLPSLPCRLPWRWNREGTCIVEGGSTEEGTTTSRGEEQGQIAEESCTFRFLSGKKRGGERRGEERRGGEYKKRKTSSSFSYLFLCVDYLVKIFLWEDQSVSHSLKLVVCSRSS